jgi:hypothetical protein
MGEFALRHHQVKREVKDLVYMGKAGTGWSRNWPEFAG